MRAHHRAAITAILIVITNQGWCSDIAVNEFRRNGESLVCVSEKPDSGYLPCLRIGPLSIGQRQAEVEKMLGEPYKVIEQDKKTTIKVYPIESKQDPQPYWVITFRSGAVHTIQLTGMENVNGYSFSSIKLGDQASRVTKVLGEPLGGTKPIKDIGGILWRYFPFPISLELVKGKVTSIRIARDTSKE